MTGLKRLSPQLSKLVAQLVYEKHRARAALEVAELRAVLLVLMRRGTTSQELIDVLMRHAAIRNNDYGAVEID